MGTILRRIFITIVIIGVLAIILWSCYLYLMPLSSPHVADSAAATSSASAALTPDEKAVSAAVVGFGAQEQQVQLLAPEAAATIASDYSPYVVPALLAQWQSDPQGAPGRVVSSPWPDHIVINSIKETLSGYEVKGTLILMSSNSVEHGGNDGTDPVVIDLVRRNGVWLISGYQDLNAG
jgi:hypothetical protein